MNEIADVTENTSIDPFYNRARNMTTKPQPLNPEAGYTATYDAWNRLVRVEAATGKLPAGCDTANSSPAVSCH